MTGLHNIRIVTYWWLGNWLWLHKGQGRCDIYSFLGKV